MRPIAFTPPAPAIPTTSVENTSGAMIILIIRKNASAIGLTATPACGTRSQRERQPVDRRKSASSGSGGGESSRSDADLGADVVGDGVNDGLLLLECELAVDGMARLSVAARSLPESRRRGSRDRQAGLQVKRDRIVDFVADTPLVEVPLQAVALTGPDDELIEDVPAVGGLDG